MPAIHKAIGKAIDECLAALAEAIVARQYVLLPDLDRHYGLDGRSKCIRDTEHHLAHLSAAVAASSPALLSDYLDWARSVLAAHDVRDEDIEGNLALLAGGARGGPARGAGGGVPPVPGGGDPLFPRLCQALALPARRR